MLKKHSFLADPLSRVVKRWTAKSPKTYELITEVALYTSIGAAVVMFVGVTFPVTFPLWVLPTAGMLVAIGSKLTKE